MESKLLSYSLKWSDWLWRQLTGICKRLRKVDLKGQTFDFTCQELVKLNITLDGEAYFGKDKEKEDK